MAFPPPQLKKKHVANYRGLLLKYADALVDLQLPNEQLLDRQIAGEMNKPEYLAKIAGQKRAQPVHKLVDEMREFLNLHKLDYNKHFLGLWVEVVKGGYASPSSPEDTN